MNDIKMSSLSSFWDRATSLATDNTPYHRITEDGEILEERKSWATRFRRIPIGQKILLILISLGLLGFFIVPSISSRSSSDSNFDMFYSSFLDFAPDPTKSHAQFYDLGQQTSLYSKILQSTNFPQLKQIEFEKKYYSWIPGLDQLKKVHGHIRQNTFQKVFSSSSNKDSKGIVMVAGDKQFRFAVQLIASMREGLKCDLPIEIYFYGQDDLKEENRKYLEETFKNVRTIDLATVGLFDENFVGLHQGGWAMKPFALLATKFTQALLTDADTIFLADPHDFFIHKEFKKTGTLYFHDRFLPGEIRGDVSDFIHQQLRDREPTKELGESRFWKDKWLHYQESGVVLVDKSNPNVFAGLLFTCWQNTKKVRDDTTYRLFHGDKETFWLSMEFSNLPYSFNPYWAGAIGPEHAEHHEGFCPDHTLHLFDSDFTNTHQSFKGSSKNTKQRPAWLNGSILKNKNYPNGNVLMDSETTIWSNDGGWSFSDTITHTHLTVCMNDYTKKLPKDLEMGNGFELILQSAQKATVQLKEKMGISD